MNKIDFVLLWVDGNDPKWLKEKEQYSGIKRDKTSSSNNRYRDWDNLRFWFRGVEKYAPWVNKIYFVTYGHVPQWLNTKNEKIVIVNHEDFIPKDFLPTFNSNTILLNLWRIKDLSEQFVVFNDDMFITKKVYPDDFFKNNLPCDNFSFNVITPIGTNDNFFHMILNNVDFINRYFTKKEVIKNNLFKLMSPRNGKDILRTILLTPWSNITGFEDYHTAYSYLKSVYKNVYLREESLFDSVCLNKFRTKNDLTEWTMRYWQLCEGKFKVRSKLFSRYYDVNENNLISIEKSIINNKQKLLCLNDSSDNINFEVCKKSLITSFSRKLKSISSFEKEK